MQIDEMRFCAEMLHARKKRKTKENDRENSTRTNSKS